MSKPTAGNESAEMDFWSHFAALRPHLVRGAAAVVVIAVAAFFARHFLIDVVLFGPKSAGFPTNRLLLETGHGLAALCGWINALTGLSLSVNPEAFDVSNLDFRVINTAMAGQFNLHMKISFVTGLVLAMPYVLWEFWRFVKPALTQREIAATHRFVFWISACFFTGLLFGYFVIVPLSVSFFINYEASASIVNMIDVNQYLSTVIVASLASALVFQLPLLVLSTDSTSRMLMETDANNSEVYIKISKSYQLKSSDSVLTELGYDDIAKLDTAVANSLLQTLIRS